jgi:hypothetical protein
VRVGLIGCSAEKLSDPAPARLLYCGPFFKLTMQWISKPGRVDEWGILSAKHGLVLPDQVIEPYDLHLDRLDYKERVVWGNKVRHQLELQWGVNNTIYMILAGAHYRVALDKMPMVEDVIRHWTEMRRLRGMKRPQMGIGVIKKYVKEDRGFGA